MSKKKRSRSSIRCVTEMKTINIKVKESCEKMQKKSALNLGRLLGTGSVFSRNCLLVGGLGAQERFKSTWDDQSRGLPPVIYLCRSALREVLDPLHNL